MSLVVYDDLAAEAARRHAMMAVAERQMLSAAESAIRLMLSRMRNASKPLTASSLPQFTSQMFALGEVAQWWSTSVDEYVAGSVVRAWNDGRRDATTASATSRSLDASGEYLAAVKNRLTGVPDSAFDVVRVALAQEIALGSPTSVISERIASELSWSSQDRPFWSSRLSDIDRQIDGILDPIGSPGSAAREAARLSDPQVRELQAMRTDASKHLIADKTRWQVQAERIARTESTAAYNAGTLNAFYEEDAGVKVWLSLIDDRTRESHLEATGQCVDISDYFSVGIASMEMPGDPSAPEEERVNCRCTMIAAADCDAASSMMFGLF